MTAREQKRITRQVAQEIVAANHGDIWDPASWVVAGQRLKAKVHELVGGDDPGFYVPGDAPCTPGIVFYDIRRLPLSQCRALVHEFAHHLLMTRVSGCLFEPVMVARYNGDPSDVRHRMAREVEQLVFDKPRRRLKK